MAVTPEQPDRETCEHLLGLLADLVEREGPAPLLAPPVEPGRDAFPEPWRRRLGNVRRLLARLAWHAGLPHAIELTDARLGAPPTERRPPTRIEATRVTREVAAFTLDFLGTDDIPGTLAHEIGVVFAAMHRPNAEAPYREPGRHDDLTIEPELDFERGSVATVYLGLGVLAANAAYQQYTASGRFNGAYAPLEYDVLHAGYLPMSGLAYLLAVQAVVRGATSPPPGLSPPQRDEVVAWIAALRADAAELRARLTGDAATTRAAGGWGGEGLAWRTAAERAPLEPFDDAGAAEGDEEPDDPTPQSAAFRWRSHRGGMGFLAGAVLGLGVCAMVHTSAMASLIALGAAGHVIGRRVKVSRCTACASVVSGAPPRCPSCGAALRGDIAHLADRLEAEERLAERSPPDA